MVARVVWDHEAAGSSPVTSTKTTQKRLFPGGLFVLYRIFYRAAYRYAPLLSSYSSICSSTLPQCCHAAKPVPLYYVVLHNLIMEAIPCRVAPGRAFFCCLFPAKTL